MVKKILIVEDESDLIKLLKYNLEKEGASLWQKFGAILPTSSF